jgi:hypothetical protein
MAVNGTMDLGTDWQMWLYCQHVQITSISLLRFVYAVVFVFFVAGVTDRSVLSFEYDPGDIVFLGQDTNFDSLHNVAYGHV